MKVWAFIFLFREFLSFALAKLYHTDVILSTFYFLSPLVGGNSDSRPPNCKSGTFVRGLQP